MRRRPDRRAPGPPCAMPRQLPVDILSELLAIGGVPPLQGGAHSDEAEIAGVLVRDSKSFHESEIPLAPGTSAAAVSLRVQLGSGNSRTVNVATPRFLIGRNRHGAASAFRLGSAQISKQHAALEQRDGRVYLRDLGSTNGTFINGRHIRNLEVDLHDGDQFQVGPVLMTLQVGRPTSTPEPVERLTPEWAEPVAEDATLLMPMARIRPRRSSRSSKPGPALADEVRGLRRRTGGHATVCQNSRTRPSWRHSGPSWLPFSRSLCRAGLSSTSSS